TCMKAAGYGLRMHERSRRDGLHCCPCGSTRCRRASRPLQFPSSLESKRNEPRARKLSMSIGKPVWTEADFDQMNWHDATVHGIAFREEAGGADLLLDIDYIARWIEPVPPSEYFTFLVGPATLVFRDVWSIYGGLGTQRTLPQID